MSMCNFWISDIKLLTISIMFLGYHPLLTTVNHIVYKQMTENDSIWYLPVTPQMLCLLLSLSGTVDEIFCWCLKCKSGMCKINGDVFFSYHNKKRVCELCNEIWYEVSDVKISFKVSLSQQEVQAQTEGQQTFK
jgi:hypothetical protein